MKLLRDLSIRNKLVLISMIPMLALIYFLQGIIRTELDRKQVTTQVYRNFQEVEKISNLIHELQKERVYQPPITWTESLFKLCSNSCSSVKQK